MSRTLGLIRDLSAKYAIIKQKVIDNNYIIKESFSSSEKGFVSNIVDKTNPVNFIPKSNQNRTELTSWHLPPKYIEQFQYCCDNFDKLEIQLGNLQQEQQKRITPKFNENENNQIDNNIQFISSDIKNNLKQIETYIHDLQNDITLNTNQEKQIKENMKCYLLTKLADFTKRLKMQQDNYYHKYIELNEDKNNVSPLEQGNIFMQDNINHNKDILEQRNKEINVLYNSINELMEMFKEVEQMVFQQGTILDRIDYNIDVIKDNSNNAHKQLIKAETSMKSSCARKTNMFLLIADLLMGIIIIFKLFK